MSVSVVRMNENVYKPDLMEGRQIKAARAMLGMTQSDLCREADISRATLNDLENDTGDPRRSSATAVEEAFRKRGVIFSHSPDSISVTVPKVGK